MPVLRDQCCGTRRGFYPKRPQWVPDLWLLLEMVKKENVSSGLVDTYYCCTACGQSWRYRQEFVGHQDVEETLTKVTE